MRGRHPGCAIADAKHRRLDGGRRPLACRATLPSSSSRSISSSSQRSSAWCSFSCAVAIAVDAASNALRSFANSCGSSSSFCCLAISACSAAIVFGSVSSACFSLKPSLRFAACGCAEDAASSILVLRLGLRRTVLRPRHVRAALLQHVAVAAGIFDPLAVALGHDHAADDAIEEIAVVADQQHRALDSRRASPPARRAFPGRGRWSARPAPARSTALPARGPASAGRARRRTARATACASAPSRTGSPACS